MVWRLIDELFETRIWKLLVAFLFIFLAIAALHLLTVANQSIQFVYLKADKNVAPGFRTHITDAYFFGILAFSILGFLSSLSAIVLIRDFFSVKQYRLLADTMLSFAHGKISARFNGSGSREIRTLGRAFNSMADSFQELIESLRESERRRSEIVADLAHDLAGPVTSISGYTETIALQLTDPKEGSCKEYLEVIRKNIVSLSHLISKLSDLSKIDRQEVSIEKDVFSLSLLVRDVCSRFALQASQRKVALGFLEDSPPALIFADAHMMERAVSNLIDNALYYTPEGGEIYLSCRERDHKIILEIKDSGIGIPGEDLPFVFERFYRVDKDRSRRSGGSGLGLAIVKKIVELHEGTVSACSVPKQGTTITLELPSTIRS